MRTAAVMVSKISLRMEDSARTSWCAPIHPKPIPEAVSLAFQKASRFSGN